MSNLDKNILITPGVGSSTDDPKIVFSAANTTANAQNITLRAYPTANGTLSVEGSAGQLFSITNQLTGTLFSVNDISGIPSIQVQDTGQIQLAPFGGYVTLNANVASNSNTTGALQVLGGVGVRGNVYADAVYSGNVLLSSAISSNVTYISGIDNAQNTRITIIEGTDVTQNAAITIIQGTDVSQNARMTIIEGINLSQNTDISNRLALTGSLNQTVSGNVTISQDLVVAGNLIVTGNVSTQNVQQLAVADPLIILGIGNYVSDTKDIGFAGHYNDGTNAHAGLIRDAGTKEFYLFKGYTPELDSNNNVIITDPTFTTANLNASYVKANLISGGINYLQISGNTSGNTPTISAAGSDTNVGINLVPQGNASVNITSTGTYTTLNLGSTTNSGYYARLVSAVDTTQPVSLYSGTDLLLRGGSTAVTTINSNNNGTAISYRSINQVFVPAPVGGLVNYTQLNGGGTGNSVIFSVGGSDTNIGMTFLPKGTGAFNIAPGSGGVNISNGGTVTAITRTATGSTYTSAPTVAVSAPTTAGGVQATVSAYLRIYGETLTSGGTGYTVNDIIKFVGGTGISTASYRVTSVSAGVVTGITLNTAGGYTTVPSNPISVTGGTGTGATITVTNWAVDSVFTITNAGSGYVEQPTVSFSGGGGSGAAAYATVGSFTTIKSIGSGTGAVTNQAFTFQTPNSITSGNPAFIIRDAASFDSWYQMGPSSSQAFLTAKGNANASAYLGASGSGSVRFTTNGDGITEQFRVSHTASAVNYLQVSGNTAANAPTISAAGSDNDIGLNINSKGLGVIKFASANGINFTVNDSVAQTNFYWQAIGGQYNGILRSSGSSTDGLIQTQGTGGISLQTSGGAYTQFKAAYTASAVNYVQVTGAATGNTVTLSSQGTDANVSIQLQAKGNGAVVVTNTLTTAQKFNQGTGLLQIAGGLGVAGNTVTQNFHVQGNNNLISYSQDFSQSASWGNTNTTVILANTTAPDGTFTGTFLQEDATNNNHYVYRTGGTILQIIGQPYTFSIFAKANQRNFIWIQGNGVSTFVKSYFNLLTGVITSVGSGHTASMVSVGNGWYRCSITFIGDVSNPSYYAFGLASASTTPFYTGDGVSGVYIWGAQIEQGYTASPYTLTTTNAITNTNNLYVPSGNIVVMGTQSSYTTSNNALTVNTSIGVANSVYVGNRVGFANSNNISVIYQSYNPSTNSLDVVFG